LVQAFLVPEISSRIDCPLVDHHNQNHDFQLILNDPETSGNLTLLAGIPVPPILPAGKFLPAITGCSGLRAPPQR
jgi:hypothetical protein